MKIIRERTGCDICKEDDAKIDGKTKYGPWAFMCLGCYKTNGIGLGTGKGQLIMVKEKDNVHHKTL